jgi:hypothetical protein
MESKINYQTVSRGLLGVWLALLIAAWIVTQPQAHMILKWALKGIAGAYIIVVILYYAKPSWFKNKVKEQPH